MVFFFFFDIKLPLVITSKCIRLSSLQCDCNWNSINVNNSSFVFALEKFLWRHYLRYPWTDLGLMATNRLRIIIAVWIKWLKVILRFRIEILEFSRSRCKVSVVEKVTVIGMQIVKYFCLRKIVTLWWIFLDYNYVEWDIIPRR